MKRVDSEPRRLRHVRGGRTRLGENAAAGSVHGGESDRPRGDGVGPVEGLGCRIDREVGRVIDGGAIGVDHPRADAIEAQPGDLVGGFLGDIDSRVGGIDRGAIPGVDGEDEAGR